MRSGLSEWFVRVVYQSGLSVLWSALRSFWLGLGGVLVVVAVVSS